MYPMRCDGCRQIFPESELTLVAGKESVHPDDDELLCPRCMDAGAQAH